MVRRILLVIFVSLSVTSLILSACAKPAPTPAPAPAPAPVPAPAPEELPPIKIGALIPYTGFGPAFGEAMDRGFDHALDEVGGEFMGRKIEFITEDTACNPETGVNKAKKLVEVDKVDVLLGALMSNVAGAVIPVITPSQTPYIAGCQHQAEVLKYGGDNVFLATGTMAGMSYELSRYCYDELGYRTASVLVLDYVAGEEYMLGFKEGFEEKGGVVVQIQRVPLGTLDFAPYLTAMKDADILAVWILADQAIRFYQQAEDYGVKMPVAFTWGGPLWEGVLQEVGPLVKGTICQTFYNPFELTGLNKKFVADMTAKYGVHPGFYEVGYYQSLKIFLEAVRVTGGDISHEAINAALREVKMDSPYGTVSFTVEGFTIGDAYILEVVERDGKNAFETITKYDQVILKAPSETVQ